MDSLSAESAVLDDVPLERLENELMAFAGHLAAATARWLVWLAAYDRRGGWESWGCHSTAHWVSWKCSMSPRAARDHVRIARRLEELTNIRGRFLAGELSYSKVRALCRVASPANEGELTEFALVATASQLERTVAGLRRVAASESADAFAAHTRRSWQAVELADGMVEFRLRVPADVAARVKAQVDTQTDADVDELAAGSGRTRHDLVTERNGLSAMRADAAVSLLTTKGSDTVDLVNPANPANPANPVGPVEVQVVVDADLLTTSVGRGELGGMRIGPEVARRLACDARVRPLVKDGSGNLTAIGHATQAITKTVRTAVHHRDSRRCQFPGCGRRRRLHIHHAIHQADGGAHTPDNLLLVCGFHHRLLHEGGWSAHVDPNGGTHHHFTSPAKTSPTKTSPAQTINTFAPRLRGAAEEIIQHRHIDPTTIEPSWNGEPFNRTYVVDCILDAVTR